MAGGGGLGELRIQDWFPALMSHSVRHKWHLGAGHRRGGRGEGGVEDALIN